MSNASAFCKHTLNVEIKFLQNKDQERYFIRSVAVFDGKQNTSMYTGDFLCVETVILYSPN